MADDMKPQSAQVLALLRKYGIFGLSQQEAIDEIGCYRLAARIADLKADGYDIGSSLVTARGIRYSRYVLREQPEQMAVGF